MFALLIYLANLPGNLLFVTKFVMTGILALFDLNILHRCLDYMEREGEGNPTSNQTTNPWPSHCPSTASSPPRKLCT